MNYLRKVSVKPKKTEKKGFTLLEMLLVIAIIAILASIVIVAINPAKQIGDANDAQRRSDVLAILNAVNQYTIDNAGDLSALSIKSGACTDAAAEWICATSDDDCDENTEILSYLATTTSATSYLAEIPVDPLTAASSSPTGGEGSSGYLISKDTTTNRITVCAPFAQNATITVTR
jgi:prepilin-type N-terminal cleavage/methylation domain-containing protein